MNEIKPKNQQCRYCANCCATENEEIGYCGATNTTVGKRSIRNACKDFYFYEIDAFYAFRGSGNPEDAIYKPRAPKKNQQIDGQIALPI